MVATAHWDALGTWCEVLTVDDADLPAAAEIARDQVSDLERACFAVGAAASELALLPKGSPRRVSPVLAGAVAAALRTAAFSDGLVGPGEGWQSVRLDADRCLLTVPDGVELDVCPSARAWLADQIASQCAEEFGIGCLVNLGGDIAVRGAVPPGGWQVELDDGPPGPRGRAVIPMAWAGGLATCSAGGGSWRTVTVAARSCERASAACRTAVVLGDSAPRWLTQRELPARLASAEGDALQTNGWPREHWVA